MTPTTRRNAMIAAIATLAALVAADRLGLFRAGDQRENDAQLTPAQSFTAESGAAAAQAALLERATDIAARLQLARETWADVERTLVVSPTPALAVSEFREAILSELRAAGVTQASVTPARVAPDTTTEGDDTGVQRIALTIRFDATDEATAYRAIERIEGMRAPATRLVALDLNGPGAMTANRVLSVELTVHAVALLATDQRQPAGGGA